MPIIHLSAFRSLSVLIVFSVEVADIIYHSGSKIRSVSYFNSIVFTLETLGILLGSEWFGVVFGQKTVDFGDIINFLLNACANDNIFKDGG